MIDDAGEGNRSSTVASSFSWREMKSRRQGGDAHLYGLDGRE
jgi:hypothetical protein